MVTGSVPTLSWPGLSRPSRCSAHCAIEIAGTNPAMTKRPDLLRPCVAYRAGHQVGHQRNLELVVVQGRGAAGRRLSGELRDVFAWRLTLDDTLDRREPPRHSADPAAGDAAVLDHAVLDRHRRCHVDQREVPCVAVGDLLEVEVGAGP